MALPLDRPIVCPVLIGRGAHLDAVDRALKEVNNQHGQTILISGEAGVGKSRLTSEVKLRAIELGYHVLEGYCFELDRTLPYAPLLDLLRSHFVNQLLDEIERELGSIVPEVVTLFPELVARLSGFTPSAPLERDQEKHRLFDALTSLVTGLAVTKPVLMVVEDLHWSDDTSLEFLLHLSRRIVLHPILLVFTYRNDEIVPSLAHALKEFDRSRQVPDFVLTPLSMSEVDEMLRVIFDLRSPVPAEVLHTIYELTEGNPFFTEEVLKSMITAGDITHASGVWEWKRVSQMRIPRTVQDAVHRRLDPLSDPARQVLMIAAVAGRRFGFELLQNLTGQDDEELLALIKELISAQLIIEESADRFAFRHALTGRAVYAELLARERRRLHREIADVMQRLYARALDSHAGDLAYHYTEAGLWSEAYEYARRAGQRATALYAPREAVAHFTRALDAASHLTGIQPFDVHLARGRAYETLGDFERARGDLERALALARVSEDRHVEWQALLDLGMLWASRDYARTGGYYRAALDLARTLEAAPLREEASANDRKGPGPHSNVLAESLNSLGNWLVNAEQPLSGQRHHIEALGIFEKQADKRGMAKTLDLLGMAYCCSSNLVCSMSTYERAIEHFRDLDDRYGLVMSLALLASQAGDYHFDPLTLDSPDLSRAVAAGEEARAIARDIQWYAGESFVCAQLGQALGVWGEYGRALAAAWDACRIAGEIEHRQWLAFANEVLGRLYLELVALPDARNHLEQSLAYAQETNSLIWWHAAGAALVSANVQQGNSADAEAILASLPGSSLEDPQTFGQRLSVCARVELELARGEPERALHLADQLVMSLAPADNGSPRLVGPPHLMRLRAKALAALGRVAEAKKALEDELEKARMWRCLPSLWRLHVALARLNQTERRRTDADRHFAAARVVIEELAARIPDKPLRDTFSLQANTLVPPPRPPTPLRAAKASYGGLTRREREVASLIAQNKTNREIADALFIGERTVATHVGHILAKLDVGSRVDVADWARARGLTST